MPGEEPQFIPIENGNAWERRLLLSSIPLLRLSETMEVEGYASGCLIDYSGSRLLLTVAHATLKLGRWVMALDVDDKGTRVYPLLEMHFLGRVATKDLLQFLQQQTTREETEMVDFSYAVVPDELVSVHDQLAEDGRSHWRAPRTVFEPTFEDIPDKREEYGFSGHAQIESCPHPTEPSMQILCGEHIVCADLKFVRTEGDMHVFKLAGNHPGHKHFRGCSGAPIINRRGKVVALVASGNVEDGTIQGVSLRMYTGAIEMHVRSIQGNQV